MSGAYRDFTCGDCEAQSISGFDDITILYGAMFEFADMTENG